MTKPAFLNLFLLIGFTLVTVVVVSQKPEIQLRNSNFEGMSLKPWEIIGNGAILSKSNTHSGNQVLELRSGTIVQANIKLKPSSSYKLSGWLKTESGSDEVRLSVNGLGENNTGVASTLANWKKVDLKFVTGPEQSAAIIEIQNLANETGNRAWADDLSIEYLSKYVPKKESGIKPLAQRVPKTDLGISQQPNSKMGWLFNDKFGMFIHWGLYSGPAKGEWYEENNGILPDQYRKLAYPESGNQYFAADKFNADDWAQLAKDAGMKYMCMVTMHHDGFALFNSKAPNAFTSQQSLDRDFVKDYVDACRKRGLRVGLYKTLIDWRYPGYYDVSGTDCKPNKFGYTTDPSHKENAREMKNELYCQIKELMTNYGKIDLIFWDGGWLGQQGSDADGAYFWESGKFLDTKNQWPVCSCFQDTDAKTRKSLGVMGIVRKYQPDVIVNSRSGWYGDIKSEEGSQPVTGPIRSEDVWQKCMTMAPGWGYTPAHNDSTKVISCGGVKRMLADCVIRNMALLLNVAPDRHGKISDVEANVLRETGQWLRQVGDAVYGTRGGPWNPKDGECGFAYKGNTIYVYLLNGYKGDEFILPAVNKDQKVVRAYSVADGNAISFKQKSNDETILKGFKQSDKEVTILAIVLNKSVMPILTKTNHP